ncbi:MAG: polysaccharide deacetylase family protein [Cellvibrionaceae bacterium]
MRTQNTFPFVFPKAVALACLLLVVLTPLPGLAAVVLQYHHISSDTPAATSISPQLFREHMAYLKEAGYEVVPLEALTASLKAGRALPDKTVAITFDDGYDSIYTTAFPILKDYGWPFTIFLNTKPLQQGQGQFVSWDNVREMAKAGATIANHSYSHTHMIRRQAGESEGEWRQRMRNEVMTTEATIAEETGQRHRVFAYPYGEYDLATVALLADLDFIAFGQQSGPLGGIEDLQVLPRFPFGGIYGNMEDFKTKVASRPMPLTKVEVRAGRRELRDTVLPQSVDRPGLLLTFAEEGIARRVQCFASGQGAIPVEVNGKQIIARAEKPLPVGRSRYNCTAMSDQAGRFYWYSQVFIRKKPNGEWYEEM